MLFIFWFLANGLAAFLDFSVGAFIVFTAYLISGYQAQIYHYFLGGVVALMPDIIDVGYLYLTSNGNLTKDNHRMFAHRPIFGLPLIFFFSVLAGGMFWGTIAIACICWHYLHDTPHINWLWPLEEDKEENMSHPSGKAEVTTKKHNDWLCQKWMTPNMWGGGEILTGTILLATIATSLDGILLGTIFVVFSFIVVQVIWSTYKKYQGKNH